jgi:hypothetical protein
VPSALDLFPFCLDLRTSWALFSAELIPKSWVQKTGSYNAYSFSPRRTVRFSRLLTLISFIFSVVAIPVLAQNKPDPRIYATPQSQDNQQNPPDYRNQPEQQSSPDYRNEPEQQNPPEYGNQPEQQNPPDYRAQSPANMPPPSPVRREPSEQWEPEAIAYLGQSASSRTEFNLDHSMVVLASKMDQNDRDLRRVIAGVDGVSVHHFRFPGYGLYDPRILADIHRQYRSAGWQHISGSHSRGGGPGATDVWVRLDNMTIRNVAVLFAGPNQVNFVSVSCAISPIDLAHLGGHFGIPQIQGGIVLPRARNNADQYPPQSQGY